VHPGGSRDATTRPVRQGAAVFRRIRAQPYCHGLSEGPASIRVMSVFEHAVIVRSLLPEHKPDHARPVGASPRYGHGHHWRSRRRPGTRDCESDGWALVAIESGVDQVTH
jgi:hypothetical protein